MPDSPQERHERELRTESIGHYLHAHAKPNGNWKDFIRSNLFAALLIWILGQSVVAVGTFVAFSTKVTSLTEWKAQNELWKSSVESSLKDINKAGTDFARHRTEEQQHDLDKLDIRVDKLETATAHLDVMEDENRRITTDVEELKRRAPPKQ